MLLKVIKFPLKIVALPFILAFGALYIACVICVGLSSIITNLLSSAFLLGAVAGWITQAPPVMIWQAVAIGAFFAIAPRAAQWLLVQLAGLIGWIIGLIFS